MNNFNWGTKDWRRLPLHKLYLNRFERLFIRFASVSMPTLGGESGFFYADFQYGFSSWNATFQTIEGWSHPMYSEGLRKEAIHLPYEHNQFNPIGISL